MNPKKKIILKLTLLAILVAGTVILLIAYSKTGDQADVLGDIESRWERLLSFAVPEKAVQLRQTTKGGPLPYGIDAHKLILLDVTGMGSSEQLAENRTALKDFYAQQLMQWHPQLRNHGKTGRLTTVQGPAGLATIDVEQFWYGDAVQGRYRSPAASYVLAKYKTQDGMGRRFAEIRILICTRER